MSMQNHKSDSETPPRLCRKSMGAGGFVWGRGGAPLKKRRIWKEMRRFEVYLINTLPNFTFFGK